MNMRNQGHSSSAQRGAALVVVMMLLLVVTLLGLGSMRNALLQERMAANTLARGYAFQTAEAAMREAEEFAAGKLTIPAANCDRGVCARTVAGAQPAWKQAGFWDATANVGYQKAGSAAGQKGVVIDAKYVVEDYGMAASSSTSEEPIDMGNDPPPGNPSMRVFRITVRSRVANGAEVVLQSLYKTPKI